MGLHFWRKCKTRQLGFKIAQKLVYDSLIAVSYVRFVVCDFLLGDASLPPQKKK
jgi:hypothetical protein